MILVASEFVSVGTVQGTSMQPTLYESDTVIILRHITPRDGDIVVIDTSKIPTYKQDAPYIIKRYYADKSNDSEIWVEGDNKEVSLDSRTAGTLNRKNIYGVVICNTNKIFRDMIIDEGDNINYDIKE